MYTLELIGRSVEVEPELESESTSSLREELEVSSEINLVFSRGRDVISTS